MKFNKAFADINGQRVIDILVSKFNRNLSETIVICNEPEFFSDIEARVHTDIIPRLGPLSGIHAGLSYAKHNTIFVCGCDMPFVSVEIIDYLVSLLDSHDSVVLDIDGRLQPTAAVYHRRCLPLINQCLEKGWLKLTRLFCEQLNAVIIKEKDLQSFGNLEQMFFNINDVNDLENARQIGRSLL